MPRQSRANAVSLLSRSCTLALCIAALISRRPDAVTLPQFWAEDGPVFYQPALDGRSAEALLQPYAGYLHVFPRLVAWAAMLVAPEQAPAVFNVTAILMAGVSLWLFTLPLARPLLASDGLRLALVLLIILSNPAVETFGNLTNLHWWMCLGALVFLSVPLGGRWLRAAACGLVGLTALSSPLPVFFVPIALVTVIAVGRPYRAAGLTLLAGAAIQILARFFLSGKEPDLPEWQGPIQLLGFALDAGHATLIQLFPGYEVAARLQEDAPWLSCALAGLLLAVLLGRALWPWSRSRCLVVGGALYLLISVTLVTALTRWYTWPSAILLQTPVPFGGRYIFLPYAMCVFLLGMAVVKQLETATVRHRLAGILALATVALAGIVSRPPMVKFADMEWIRQVQEARVRGEATILINPGQPEWVIKLKMPRR